MVLPKQIVIYYGEAKNARISITFGECGLKLSLPLMPFISLMFFDSLGKQSLTTFNFNYIVKIRIMVIYKR